MSNAVKPTLIARFSMNKVGQNKKHVLFSFISTNFRDIKKVEKKKGKKVAPIICARKKKVIQGRFALG